MNRQNPFAQIPPVTRNLLIAIVVMYVAQVILKAAGGNGFYTIIRYFPLYPFSHEYFYPWQLLTHGLIHLNLLHLFFSAFALWMFGSQIEHFWGEKKYALFIILTIIGSGLFSALLSPAPAVGLNGMMYGLLLAFGMMWPNHTIMLILPPMPIKAKYLVIAIGAMALLQSLDSQVGLVAAMSVPVGGMITGFLIIQYWRQKPPFKW